MVERVRTFGELLSRYPSRQVDVSECPSVSFRVDDNTWLEVVLHYIVEPKQSGAVRTRLLRAKLDKLNEQPEKVRFPRGDPR